MSRPPGARTPAGRGTPDWLAVVILCLLGGVLLVTYALLVHSLPVPQAGTMLDAARNVYEGRGLVGREVIPAFLPYYRRIELPVPYLWYPLVPVITAGLFGLLGVRPWLLLAVPVLSYLLAGLALYALGRRLFGRKTGMAAAAFLLLQPMLIRTTVELNFSDPILVFLLVAAVLCVFTAASGNRAVGWLALGGAALGAAQYARSAGMMLYLPMALLVLMSFSESRWRRLAAFLSLCFVVQVPLFVWNLRTIGAPTFTPTYVFLFMTASFPGLSAITQLVSPSPLVVLKLYGGEILRKWLGQVWVHYKYLLTMTNPLTLTAALLTLSLRFGPPQARLRLFTLALYLCLVVQNSLVLWDNRYLLPLVPFVALLGFEFIRTAAARLRPEGLARRIAVVLLAILVSTEAVDFFYQAAKGRGERLRRREARQEVARLVRDNVNPDAVIMTVEAGRLAWSTAHVAIELPTDLETAVRIYRDYVRFDTIILSRAMSPGGLYNYSPDWIELAAGRKAFLGFSPDKELALASGETLVVLTDKSRPVETAGASGTTATAGSAFR